MSRFAVLVTVLVSSLVAGAVRAQAQKGVRAPKWDPATVAAMATLPIQEGGRIKPLSAFAAETLHLVHGRRDMKLDTDGDGKNDVTKSPTEWMLDVMFQPADASEYPLVRIENVDVFDAIGIAHEGVDADGVTRDRGQSFNFEYLSWRQLVTPGKDGKMPAATLWELARTYRQKEERDRTPVEAHIVHTDQAVGSMGAVMNLLAPLQAPFALEGADLRALYDGKESVDLATLLGKGAQFGDLVQRFRGNGSDAAAGNVMQVASALVEFARQEGRGIALFPPMGDVKAAPEWRSIPAVIEAGFGGRATANELVPLAALQRAVVATTVEDRDRSLREFREATVKSATERGEYGKVELEDYYLRAEWHYQALHTFLFAIVVVVLGWLLPRSKLLWIAGVLVNKAALACLIADVTLRCIVRGRPPILNLYDTFLFIASVGVAAAIAAEYWTRRRVALALAPIFGALLVTLARAFEVESGTDQMAPLQAVLDTNYYLATHVTAINMGYAAGMFASFLGTTWLLMNAIGFRRGDAAFHKAVVRATYGVTAFGLVFAVFGTIYGGVWANDSWGRFWGWDPKENGALLICLAQVALIHARMCGWVRDLGFCFFAAAIGIVVAFSWFHVNLLGIGLHSYGFSSATKNALYYYYGIQGGLTLLGGLGVLGRQHVAATTTASGAAASAV